uniref:Putative secreted protein n=1 Tax=Xenopsylla cheopis TaxID=163159 RepID=A0A6M2E2M3_XENCH
MFSLLLISLCLFNISNQSIKFDSITTVRNYVIHVFANVFYVIDFNIRNTNNNRNKVENVANKIRYLLFG